MIAPAHASASCDAVASGAFNLTNTALGPSHSSLLFSWEIGDRITLTLSSSDGISRQDGLYSGPTFASGTFAPLELTTVPTTGTVNLVYAVGASDLTNGIAVDPENNDSVTATCTPGIDTTTTLTSSRNPSIFGEAVTFKATVAPVSGSGTPTGTVTFLDGGSSIGGATLSGGVATLVISTLAGGSHTITATYGSDAKFNRSTGSLAGNPQVVTKAATTTKVISSKNPSVFGAPVTFTATVAAVAPGSGTPSGAVTFLDGGRSIGGATLSGGVAIFTTSALAVGSHTITATYTGNADFDGSAGSLTGNPQVVHKAATTTKVVSSQNPSIFGQPVTFTATVAVAAPGSGTPAGTLTFFSDGNSLGGGTLSGGVANLTISTLAVGRHTITATYGGSGTFDASTGPLAGNPQVVSTTLAQVAWALANQPSATKPYQPPAGSSYNSTGGKITITRSGTGYYNVALSGFAIDPPYNDDVQVTARGGTGYCNVVDWGSVPPLIYVNCYTAGGTAADGEFTILYQKRYGHSGSAAVGNAFVWANEPTTSSYTPSTLYQYNSTGGTNTITRSSTGKYSVLLPGLTHIGGQVQVTAYDTNGRCWVTDWNVGSSGTTVNVGCADASGAPADEYFDLAYSIGTTFGDVNSTTAGIYAWANADTKQAYNPDLTYAYNGLTSGKLTIKRTSVGVYNVTIPGSPSFTSAIALATGYNTAGGYCGVVKWTGTTVYVDCRSSAGTPADERFDVTFQTHK